MSRGRRPLPVITTCLLLLVAPAVSRAYDVYRDIQRQVADDRRAGRYRQAIQKLEIALAGIDQEHELWHGFTVTLAELYATVGEYGRAIDEYVDLAARVARELGAAHQAGTRDPFKSSVLLSYRIEVARCYYVQPARRAAKDLLSHGLDNIDMADYEGFESIVGDAYLTLAVMCKHLGEQADTKSAVDRAMSLFGQSAARQQGLNLSKARELCRQRRYYMADYYYDAAALVPGDIPVKVLEKEAAKSRSLRAKAVDAPKP